MARTSLIKAFFCVLGVGMELQDQHNALLVDNPFIESSHKNAMVDMKGNEYY